MFYCIFSGWSQFGPTETMQTFTDGERVIEVTKIFETSLNEVILRHFSIKYPDLNKVGRTGFASAIFNCLTVITLPMSTF